MMANEDEDDHIDMERLQEYAKKSADRVMALFDDMDDFPVPYQINLQSKGRNK